MTWNYRVVKTEEGYSIYEVLYNEDGKPISCTENPILDFYCDSPKGLKHELNILKKAFKKPPLDLDNIGLNK